MPILYFEQQEAALCGKHCLNNLVQGHMFDEGMLAQIAHELDRKERALMLSEGAHTAEARAFLAEASGNIDASGNFSVQVLSNALQHVCGRTLEDTRHPDNKFALNTPVTQQGFVLNRDAHWYCLRNLGGSWYKLNSMDNFPESISIQNLKAMINGLVRDNWSVFVVAGGVLPPPTPPHAGAKNYVDTSRPPPGSGFQRLGGPASALPTHTAFAGQGQTLGGGGGGGGGGGDPSAMSEEQQLAAALALSRGAAVTERLKTRLPDEPEKGARIAVSLPDGSSAQRRFPTDALLQSLVDFVALQLAEKGIAGENWVMAERGPGGLKLKFSADATADCDEAKQTFQASGISGARLTVSKA